MTILPCLVHNGPEMNLTRPGVPQSRLNPSADKIAAGWPVDSPDNTKQPLSHLFLHPATQSIASQNDAELAATPLAKKFAGNLVQEEIWNGEPAFSDDPGGKKHLSLVATSAQVQGPCRHPAEGKILPKSLPPTEKALSY
jgi:hypothetical protein